MSKSMIWLGIFVGSLIGGSIPSLFHAGIFSLWGIVGSFVGAIVGIWFVFKFTGE